MIQEMAIVDPEKRASAAQMLVKCFNGVGLSTPRNQVPALPISPPAVAPAKAPARAPPALTTRTAQAKPKAHRVEKAHSPFQAQHIRRLQELRGKQAES
jgi:hypothetical protein